MILCFRVDCSFFSPELIRGGTGGGGDGDGVGDLTTYSSRGGDSAIFLWNILVNFDIYL